MFSTVAAKHAGLVASTKRPVAPDRRAKPVACPRASADSEKPRSVVSRPEDTNKIALSRRDAPDDLAPAYDTFLAAMTSWLELVGG